jgi:tRNA U34 5-carboxymethylaminomethyl modifying enzyme MnmG/GidA
MVPICGTDMVPIWGASGAGRNAAANVARLGCEVALVTDLGTTCRPAASGNASKAWE